jgi:hypothetical protein
MPSMDELVPIADASAFIFTGSIARTGAAAGTALPTDAPAVVVSVEEVLKAPNGLRGLKGSEVTVQLLRPLENGRYVFFAEPVAVGKGIVVRERAHLDATARGQRDAASAIERGYSQLIERRAQEAFLVALGTTGTVRHLVPLAKRRGPVPWASARFEIERVLKGRGKLRQVALVGPSPASKWFHRAPALRPGLHAILFLQHPPAEALEHVSAEERQTAAYIADTTDIQPPEKLETILQILGAGKE